MCIARAALILTCLFIAHTVLFSQTPADYADPRLGVSNNTFAGPTLPFGMVQFSPDRNGFGLTQFSGAGCRNMGNFPVKVHTGDAVTPGAAPQFSKSNEVASPGYYSVTLNDGTKVELTATMRTGMARITFPSTAVKGSIIIDVAKQATNTWAASAAIDASGLIKGMVQGGSFCHAVEWGQNPNDTTLNNSFTLYCAAKFNQSPTASGTYNGATKRPGATSATGTDCGAYASFDTRTDKVVLLKIGLSYVSRDNALLNLNAENAGWSFDSIRAAARIIWNSRLSQITVTGGTPEDKTVFYTALYHSLIHPNIFNDVNGQYIGFDRAVHTLSGRNVYSNFSGWDVYRCQMQLMAILAPDVASDFSRTLVRNAQEGQGGFGRWLVANDESGIMLGEPTTPSISAMYGFGATDIDIPATLAVMRKVADVPYTKSVRNQESRPGLPSQLRVGYVYGGDATCEYGITDFSLAMFMALTGQGETLFRQYLKRSQAWRHVYNPATKWLQCRDEAGVWKGPDDSWTEGTKEQYFWLVPHNLAALIDTIGGKTAATARLDILFSTINGGFNSHNYNQGNEPDIHVPWAYNWTGNAHKTQTIVRRIATETYKHSTTFADQLPGDDDLGTMSAWYVFAALGFYPVIPGAPGFSISGPMFTDVTVRLGNGNTVRIAGGSNGREDSAKYIQSLAVNGVSHPGTWLDWSEISAGATLTFVMGKSPQPAWGNSVPPPSFSATAPMPAKVSVLPRRRAGSVVPPQGVMRDLRVQLGRERARWEVCWSIQGRALSRMQEPEMRAQGIVISQSSF